MHSIYIYIYIYVHIYMVNRPIMDPKLTFFEVFSESAH